MNNLTKIQKDIKTAKVAITFLLFAAVGSLIGFYYVKEGWLVACAILSAFITVIFIAIKREYKVKYSDELREHRWLQDRTQQQKRIHY
jgi:membrane protein YdbS with pleckstrin-like domain